MTLPDARAELAAAREDVLRSRARLAGTASELESRVLEPLTRLRSAATAPLSRGTPIVEGVLRDQPWAALALAAGAGFVLAASAADRRAAALVAEEARAAAERARRQLADAQQSARSLPLRARGALLDAGDALAARLVQAVVEGLRERGLAPADPAAPTPASSVADRPLG